jgi:hypothetical protein
MSNDSDKPKFRREFDFARQQKLGKGYAGGAREALLGIRGSCTYKNVRVQGRHSNRASGEKLTVLEVCTSGKWPAWQRAHV